MGHKALTQKKRAASFLAAAPDYECLSTSDMNHDRTKRTPPPKTTETSRAYGILGEETTACGMHKLNIPDFDNFYMHNQKCKLLSSADVHACL